MWKKGKNATNNLTPAEDLSRSAQCAVSVPQKQTPRWLLMTSKEVWTLSRLKLQPNTAYKGISNRLTATVDYISERRPTQLFTYLGVVEQFKPANCRSFLVQERLYSSDTSIWEAQLGSDVYGNAAMETHLTQVCVVLTGSMSDSFKAVRNQRGLNTLGLLSKGSVSWQNVGWHWRQTEDLFYVFTGH